ncbi:MAG: FtsQ-type POTRA domain-containing protein [Microthrixaceae bacterium]
MTEGFEHTRRMDLRELAREIAARPEVDLLELDPEGRPVRSLVDDDGTTPDDVDRERVDTLDGSGDVPDFMVPSGGFRWARNTLGSAGPPSGGGEGVREVTPDDVAVGGALLDDGPTVPRFPRLRRTAVVAGMVVALVALGAGVLFAPPLTVRRIDIIGSKTLTRADVERLTGVSTGTPMLLVRSGSLTEALRRDRRLQRVVVTMRFPSTIEIRATDRRLVGVLATPGGGLVVAEGGVVVGRASAREMLFTATTESPVRTAVGRRLPQRFADAFAVVDSMGFDVAAHLKGMHIANDGSITFDLSDGGIVRFGGLRGAATKVNSMRAMLSGKVDLRGVCLLDVRVAHLPVIRRDPDCSPRAMAWPVPTTALPASPTVPEAAPAAVAPSPVVAAPATTAPPPAVAEPATTAPPTTSPINADLPPDAPGAAQP